MNMANALEKGEGFAHKDGWAVGTYIFTRKGSHGVVVYMKRKDKKESFILPTVVSYLVSKNFYPGKGVACEACRLIQKEYMSSRVRRWVKKRCECGKIGFDRNEERGFEERNICNSCGEFKLEG